MSFNFSRLPQELAYLKSAAQEYGSHCGVVADLDRLVAGLTPAQLEELSSAYNEIVRREDVHAISHWLDTCDKGQWRWGAAGPLQGLLITFDRLADRGTPPFSSRQVRRIRPPPPPFDWTKLPDDLRYLAEPAERYGEIGSDADLVRFLEAADETQLASLAALAERIRLAGHLTRINQWLDQYSITDHREAAAVYFLMLLLDLAGFNFE